MAGSATSATPAKDARARPADLGGPGYGGRMNALGTVAARCEPSADLLPASVESVTERGTPLGPIRDGEVVRHSQESRSNPFARAIHEGRWIGVAA